MSSVEHPRFYDVYMSGILLAQGEDYSASRTKIPQVGARTAIPASETSYILGKRIERSILAGMLYFRQAKWSKIEQPVAQSAGIAIKNLYEKGPKISIFQEKAPAP